MKRKKCVDLESEVAQGMKNIWWGLRISQKMCDLFQSFTILCIVIDNHKSKDSTASKNNNFKKMYKCGVCKKIFSQMGQIMKHLQSHKRKEFTTFTMSKSEVNFMN